MDFLILVYIVCGQVLNFGNVLLIKLEMKFYQVFFYNLFCDEENLFIFV